MARIPTVLAAAVAVAALSPAARAETPAGTRPLTLDVLYDPASKLDFAGTAPRDVTWISETRFRWSRTDPRTRDAEHFVGDAVSGAVRLLFDPARLEEELARLGVPREKAKRAARLRGYTFDRGTTALFLEAGGDLFRLALDSGRVERLTETAGKDEEEPALSPDGKRLAFVRDHDLYVMDLATRRETRLTTDGAPQVLNGLLDWVYQEEIYGRGQWKAHWWSPDSTTLAFLQLDDRAVPQYTLVDEIEDPPGVEATSYPRPGEPNPKVKIGTVRADGGPTRWIDLSAQAAADPLIVGVSWTPDGLVAFEVQDREQTFLDLEVADASGVPRTLVHETTRAYVDAGDRPQWLKDGTFLWLSERDGYKHVYHYRRDGSLIGQVTRGPWEARTLHGVDERAGVVFFSGTERSPIGGDVYRVRLDGSGLTRLSERPGTHIASFSPSFARYVDTWSDVSTPPQARIHSADGRELRVVDAAPVAALAAFRLSRPEFLQVTTRDGFPMEAMLIKPPDFDPSRRYPVLQSTYAGPHAPRVKNAWGDVSHLFLQLVAQQGVVVWVCDNRSASGKGALPTWGAYKRMGVGELQDIEDGLGWLRAQPWVDAARIGIEGWSYGGFMTAYALTHSTSFAMGIAGAPVTDWRLYDSVYTERYMGLPSKNAAGYDETSPLKAAANLHGRLLLIHGAIDDNVHPQNAQRFAYALQKANKPFRMMVYPKSRHGVTEAALLRHLRGLQLSFIEETLLGRPPS